MTCDVTSFSTVIQSHKDNGSGVYYMLVGWLVVLGLTAL